MWVNLRQKATNFLLPNRHVAIAEEQVDRSIDLHLETGLVTQFNPFREARSCDSLAGLLVNFRIVLATDYPSAAIRLKSFRYPQRADAAECARFDHQLRFDGRHYRAEKLKHFDLGGHRVEHAPALGMRAFGRSTVIFAVKLVSALNLPQNAVLLFFLLKKTAKR